MSTSAGTGLKIFVTKLKGFKLNNSGLLITGIVGTVIAALCCFTSVLVIVLGAVGLSAWVGGLDYVLLPTLGLFVLITVYALYRRRAH